MFGILKVRPELRSVPVSLVRPDIIMFNWRRRSGMSRCDASFVAHPGVLWDLQVRPEPCSAPVSPDKPEVLGLNWGSEGVLGP